MHVDGPSNKSASQPAAPLPQVDEATPEPVSAVTWPAASQAPSPWFVSALALPAGLGTMAANLTSEALQTGFAGLRRLHQGYGEWSLHRQGRAFDAALTMWGEEEPSLRLPACDFIRQRVHAWTARLSEIPAETLTLDLSPWKLDFMPPLHRLPLLYATLAQVDVAFGPDSLQKETVDTPEWVAATLRSRSGYAGAN